MLAARLWLTDSLRSRDGRGLTPSSIHRGPATCKINERRPLCKGSRAAPTSVANFKVRVDIYHIVRACSPAFRESDCAMTLTPSLLQEVTLSARDTDCDPARAVRGVHALR